MNNYVTEAINLKSYNLNDADKIIVMYSKDNGLIKGVAKGIKKPKSKAAPILIKKSVLKKSIYSLPYISL